MKTLKPILLILLQTVLTGVVCAKEYRVTGKVVALRPETRVAVIHHDPIDGLMPSMTMPFTIPEETDFLKLKRGYAVSFLFVMDGDGSHAKDFVVTGAALPSIDRSTGSTVARLEEGDALPGVTLQAAGGGALRLAEEDGRLTLLTFVFSRCPVPEFCPLIGARFKEIQDWIKEENLTGDVRLLSVTIDPEYDTPAVLAAYATSLGAEARIWEFATAGAATIDRLTSAFRVYIERDGQRLDHGLCTALIDRRGKVRSIWRGNGWTTDTVLTEIRKVL